MVRRGCYGGLGGVDVGEGPLQHVGEGILVLLPDGVYVLVVLFQCQPGHSETVGHSETGGAQKQGTAS